ncbi:uncharacterized protein LOC141853404 isoform X2 [Brevipalpus obovatus]|uniref:uncharacterized protein LOC141853404 isoform X2 n=1 Tax=Brevipalpus obovatus TaxID=246614 RepID=UPI003D9E4487
MDHSESSLACGKDFEEFGLESEVESCFSRFSSKSKLSVNKLMMIEKIREANLRCQQGDYQRAIKLYTEAINMDPLSPSNHVLFGNRSAAYCGAGKFTKVCVTNMARELAPRWAKAYYRQGIALRKLGRGIDALAAFASGLAQDKDSPQLLARLIETALKCPLRTSIAPLYRQLQALNSDKNAFIITSVIGQEVLAAGHYPPALIILDSALRIGTRSLKLKGSIYSALGCAYWVMGDTDKAIHFMQQDLEVAKSFGDHFEECRAQGNLGAAHFCRGNFKEALVSYEYQYVLAKKANDTEKAATALNALGHVYLAIDDAQNALSSHEQCLQIVRKLNDRNAETREVGSVGSIYLAMKEFDKVIECQVEHLRMAKSSGNKLEEAKAYANLASAYHSKEDYDNAVQYNQRLLRLAQEMGNQNIEARAYSGFGRVALCVGKTYQAKHYFHLQLEMVLATQNRLGESRALSNLGLVHYLIGDYDGALKLHQESLTIARQLNDHAGVKRAYGNIIKCYSKGNVFDQTMDYHKQELLMNEKTYASTEENAELSAKLRSMDLVDEEEKDDEYKIE